eukprot:s4061_g7.t2
MATKPAGFLQKEIGRPSDKPLTTAMGIGAHGQYSRTLQKNRKCRRMVEGHGIFAPRLAASFVEVNQTTLKHIFSNRKWASLKPTACAMCAARTGKLDKTYLPQL